MLVYELFGMPGSGKTTYCKKIEKNLKICNVMNFYKENIFGKIYFKLWLKFFYINNNLKNKYLYIENILGNLQKYKNVIDERIDIKLYIKYILFVYFLEKKNTRDIIFDEGIIHYCIALYAEFNVPFEKTDKILKYLNLESRRISIGIKCNIFTALNQIKERNRKQTPIDFLDELSLKSLLNRYLTGVKYYSNNHYYYDSKEIMNFIKERGKISEV